MTIYDLQDVIQRRMDGQSWMKIGKHYGAHKNSVISWAKKQEGFPPELFKPLRLAPVTTEELREMVEVEHLTDDQIALRIGANSRHSVSRLRARRGVYRVDEERRARARPAIPQDELDKVKTYVDEGYPVSTIEQITGVSYGAIKRHFPHAGLSPEEKAQHAGVSLGVRRLK